MKLAGFHPDGGSLPAPEGSSQVPFAVCSLFLLFLFDRSLDLALFYAPAIKVCFSLITAKLRTGDAIVSNTSRFTDQQSRNVSLSNRKKAGEKAAGKKKKEKRRSETTLNYLI